MTETNQIPGATYRVMLQMVSQRPKQVLHQTKILVKNTTKNHKNYPNQIIKFFLKIK